MNKFLLIAFLILISLFRVNTIHCQIGERNCSPELYQKLESIKGKSLFLINFDKELALEKFESETILLKNYQKKFPGSIILNFNEEKVLYQHNNEEGNFFISEFGNTLQNNQGNKNLTKIDWSTQIDQEKHLKIAKIINVINQNGLIINEIIWENNKEIILKIDGYPKIIIDIDAINTKINSLGSLLDSQEIKDFEEPIKEIDLRFNLPVLRTAQ